LAENGEIKNWDYDSGQVGLVNDVKIDSYQFYDFSVFDP
jgi:hypothetical protein